MKARLTMATAATAALVASMLVGAAPPAQAQSGGFQISGTNLLDANGNNFVIRGVSHPHVWYQGETESFAEISDLGANAVRVVLGSGQRWGPSSASDVANVINLCKQNQLICILEVHDTTGFGEEGAAASLQQAVSYWQSIQSVLEGEEAYVLINIGNEPYGNQNYDPNWANDTISAIQSMRSAGFDHTLVVDAPNWGQDWSGTMQAAAPQVAAADNQGNTLFSIHMYGVYNTAQAVTSYLDAFQNMGLPLMIGEFGHNHSDGDPDENTIMAEAVSRGIGYIGWSYSGNSGGVEYLDMTNNFDPNSLTSWGQRIFNGANGIVQTAQRATVFDGGGGDDPPATPTDLTVTGTTASSVSLSWNASAGATSYQVQRAPGASGGSFSQVGSTGGTSFTDSGLSAEQTFRYRVIASNSAGSSDPTGPVSATTDSGGGGGGDCEIAYSANEWGGSPGFTANVTVTNTGSSSINGWTVQWDYPGGQTVVEPGWNATVSQSGTTVTAVDAGWNGTLAAGQSTSFGFNGSMTSVGNNPAPSAFTLNGASCSVG